MSDETEQTPDYIASMDQLTSMVVPLAHTLATYYGALVGCGFEPNHAFALVIAYQARLLGQ